MRLLQIILGRIVLLRRSDLLLQTQSVCISSVWLSVTIVSPAETAEPIEMPFSVWTRVGPMKHVFDGVHIGATWRIQLNRPCAAAMRLYVKLLGLLVIIIIIIIIT